MAGAATTTLCAQMNSGVSDEWLSWAVGEELGDKNRSILRDEPCSQYARCGMGASGCYVPLGNVPEIPRDPTIPMWKLPQMYQMMVLG